MFSGLYVALVTPFTEEGELNEAALRELVRFHVEAGTEGLVPCGTTGESATLRGWEERARIIEIIVSEAQGRLQVIPGVGTNATAETVANLERLGELGVDGALVITPYYNKPTQAGLEAHFRAAAAASPVPIVMYNVPGRTGVHLHYETVARLAEVERIAALKEASGDLVHAAWIERLCGSRLELLSGEDALNYPLFCLGAVGTISVLGNLVPRDVRALIAAVRDGHQDEARGWHRRLLPLAEALFLETNPLPIKQALADAGFAVGPTRLPLAPLQPQTRERLRAAVRAYHAA